MESFADRLAIVRSDIEQAAVRVGRATTEIALIAVSKTHPPEAVSEAIQAGHHLFGESRVQEARAKIPLVEQQARWHFIGHLQKNKVRQALPLFELFHSVDTLELARDIDRIAGETGTTARVLLEVNVAGESTKFGFSREKLLSQMEELLVLRHLKIEGLMTIAPYAEDPEHSRPYFIQMRSLRDKIQTSFDVSLPQLSMGMSGDYRVAVEEGATLVRVGTALFGNREGKGWRPAT